MADADTALNAREVKLQVAAARQEESGHGIARIPREAMGKLGITEGDIIEIEGDRKSVV